MTVYLGELIDGGTHDFMFTTVNGSGVPTTLAGTPVLSVYKDNSTTETTTGPTLTADFDTRTGLNQVRLVLTDAFYVADTDYSVVITTGTVNGNSVVGYVVAQFSIQNRGVDWGNIQRPTTAVDLSGTDIQLVDTTTTNTDMVGTDDALLAASAPTNFGDLAITVTTGLVSVGTNNDKTGYSISGTITTLDGLNDVAATDIVSAGAITTSSGAVSTVTTLTDLTTTTFAEPAQGTPGATISLKDKLGFLYKFMRNKADNDGTTLQIYNDDTTTVDHKSAVSESGGTVTRNEFATGP